MLDVYIIYRGVGDPKHALIEDLTMDTFETSDIGPRPLWIALIDERNRVYKRLCPLPASARREAASIPPSVPPPPPPSAPPTGSPEKSAPDPRTESLLDAIRDEYYSGAINHSHQPPA